MKLLDRMGASAVPDVDVVIEYKLKRAEVNVIPAGAMVLRTARIFAWVRVHDRRTMEILFDDAVEVSIGGTIARSESTGGGTSWDSYSDGFMLRSGSTDKAIEAIEVKEVVTEEVIEKAEAPSVSPASPATQPVSEMKTETGVGGMLKGMFGG
jgi:hypothetical protein